MSFSVVDEIYKKYSSDNKDENTEEANKYFDELFAILEDILSLDLQNKIYDLIVEYSDEVEKRSFKDGFKYATSLYRELQ